VKTTDLEVKTDLPAEMKTERFELIIEGVRMLVRLDEQGRLVTLIAGGWRGGDAERITRLALEAAQWRVKSEAEQRAKVAHDATRTAKSTETKRKKARNHWSLKWLEDAYKLHPDYGAERLALEACKQVALNREKDSPEYAKRHQITKDRARKYLETVRNK
jgi:hypothetical protein